MRLLLQAQSSIISKGGDPGPRWGYDSEAVENHVEVYVGFLRKKLGSIGSNIRIEAVRRLGYRLRWMGMLKRLRIQFVAVVMVIVTIMLCTVLGCSIFTRSSLEQESLAMMRAVPVECWRPVSPLCSLCPSGREAGAGPSALFVVQEEGMAR